MEYGWKRWHAWFARERKAYGTQEKFSHASGIGLRMIGHYEAGTKRPRPDTIATIERVLEKRGPATEVPVEEWVSLEDRVAIAEDKLFEIDHLRERVSAIEQRADVMMALIEELREEVQANRTAQAAEAAAPRGDDEPGEVVGQ